MDDENWVNLDDESFAFDDSETWTTLAAWGQRCGAGLVCQECANQTEQPDTVRYTGTH
jgi:hypothetical protein